MRSTVFAALLVFVLSSASAQPNPAGGTAARPLVGAWRLVSGHYVGADGRMSDLSGDHEVHSLKILTDDHFSFITVGPDGTFIRAVAGRYSVEGHQYTETVDYTSVERMRGKSYTFTWRVDGDTWYHHGKLGDVTIDEVWRRAR